MKIEPRNIKRRGVKNKSHYKKKAKERLRKRKDRLTAVIDKEGE